MAEENMQFKAEIKDLLDLMIHSVYSNKEIFLRELVANAADAIDKLRFLSLTKPELACEGEIRIIADEAAGTLTIRDNGIGMTKAELIENLGTIAHSGTKAFMNRIRESKADDGKSAPELIGQFGVGFYSAFMAADKVTVESRKAGENAGCRWISDGKEEFSVSDIAKESCGTDVILHLTDDFKQFMDYWKISGIIQKYSDYIEYPIKMQHKVRKDKDTEEIEDSTMNSMKAIWLRNESEVKEEEYESFYQHLTQDYGKPAKRICYHAEGASDFKALLFFSAHMPFNLQFGQKNHKNLHLYVKRVFITDECPGIIPEYMGFVSGVVDSSDLPLNVSREMLQDNPQIHRICKSLTKRILSELASMLEKDREKYLAFYKEFGRMIKEGVHADWSNREKLQDLMLFQTMNKKAGEFSTLKEYADAMKPDQKAIYYIAGDSRENLEHSPQLELMRKHGLDVLFLLDPADEFVLSEIGKYGEKELISVSKGDIKLDEVIQKELDKKTEEAAKTHKALTDFLKKSLENKVKDVRFSARLTESPCCLVSDSYDPSVSMQKLMKALDKNTPDVKRILELNADAPLILAMNDLLEKSPKSDLLPEFAEMLYDQALISEGSELPDPVEFAKRTAKLMTASLKKELSAE